MQEHDLSFVRVEMVLAQQAPADERGLARWVRKNLFATPIDAVLTLVGLIVVALTLPPLINWLFISAQWTGPDRSVCATVAQGGVQPDGWSGACWAFVNAKFEQFMVGRYTVSERWRVWLVAIMFVGLLTPLMIPRVPRKGLNAIVLFGVFPFIAFMLLIGTALPFGLIGFAGLMTKTIISILGGAIYLIFSVPTAILSVFDILGVNTSGGVGDSIRSFGGYGAYPFEYLAQVVDRFRAWTESLFGATPSLWIDLLISFVAVLAAMRWLGASSRTIGVTAGVLVVAGLTIRLTGLDVGLPYVETQLWGGLMVTLVLSFVGIAVSLPFGIVLALGRRSKLPVVKMICIIFIETIRGVPLVTVLFMASVMLPLFLPAGMSFDKFLRALIGVSLFASAYMAEVVRGGLQAIPKGQYEGAESLGLSYWQKTWLIVLPQALKLVIPGIVNTFIGLFKDTSLVYIIGMFDLLGIVRQNFADAAWASAQTPMSGLVFSGFMFWIFCFGMSRYSMYMERRLDTGHKR